MTARLTYIDDILTKKSKSVTLTSKPCPSLGMMLRKSLNLRILSCQILMKSIKGSWKYSYVNLMQKVWLLHKILSLWPDLKVLPCISLNYKLSIYIYHHADISLLVSINHNSRTDNQLSFQFWWTSLNIFAGCHNILNKDINKGCIHKKKKKKKINKWLYYLFLVNKPSIYFAGCHQGTGENEENEWKRRNWI